jgi:hypothetical protein
MRHLPLLCFDGIIRPCFCMRTPLAFHILSISTYALLFHSMFVTIFWVQLHVGALEVDIVGAIAFIGVYRASCVRREAEQEHDRK